MSRSEKAQERIRLIDERLARLRSEKERLEARVSQAERKRATRRKIVIGGTVLAALDHEGIPSMRTEAELKRWLEARLTRPHDRAVFDLNTPKSA
jgi:chromosome segregation ATPase